MATESTESAHNVHLIVFVHGLWGSPGHLDNLAAAIRDRHSEELLHILVTKSNSGTLTYDGIETGGERVAHEIEDELRVLGEQGTHVKRFSVVGYSLGGLLARYAIGLLDNKGYFDDMAPINFTTFATPHLGTRTPLTGWSSQLYNDLGPRTLSISGHQLWMIDQFRDTGRPLLSVMTDPNSIFMQALGRFKNRSLYSNIVNDRSVPFYTSCIESRDPFVDLDAIDINYLPDTEDVLLRHPMGDEDSKGQAAVPRKTPLTFYESVSSGASRFVAKAPLYFFMATLAPIGATVFLASSGIQSYRSAARIKEHQEGRTGTDYSHYRFPLLPEGVKEKALEALTQVTHAQHQETLQPPDVADVADDTHSLSHESGTAAHEVPKIPPTFNDEVVKSPTSGTATSQEDNDLSSNEDGHAAFAKLALTNEQFEMIEHLNSVGFNKYPVHIKKANHTHAAIIVRMNRPGFGEGRIVAKHWVDRWEI